MHAQSGPWHADRRRDGSMHLSIYLSSLSRSGPNNSFSRRVATLIRMEPGRAGCLTKSSTSLDGYVSRFVIVFPAYSPKPGITEQTDARHSHNTAKKCLSLNMNHLFIYTLLALSRSLPRQDPPTFHSPFCSAPKWREDRGRSTAMPSCGAG